MGWTPAEVGAASLWQFMAAWDGYVKANTSKGSDKLSDDEADELFDWLDASSDSPTHRSTSVYRMEGGRLVWWRQAAWRA